VKSTQNPYQTGIADKPIIGQGDISSQIRQFDDEEAQSKAPPILPFPLEPINPLLSDLFNTLLEIRKILKRAANEPTVDKDKIEFINNEIDEISTKILLDIPARLAIIAL
jgi:hypothetical protein